MNRIKELLGKRIREIREAKGISQETLAEMIGIEPPSLSSIEHGKSYPTAKNIDKIATSLGVLPSELFTFEHIKMPPIKNAIEEVHNAMLEDEDLAQKMYIVYRNLKA